MAESVALKPLCPCSNCGSTDWWWRQNNWAPKGEYLCNRCHPNPNKEAEMSTDKGHCRHGEFILTEGCPQCIAEARQAKEADKAGSLPLWEEPAPELIGAQLAEEAGIVEAEEDDESYRAPYNASYHPPYRLQDGTIVPSVTTVLKVLDKGEGMQYWAWDLGQQGLDYREFRDSAARVGTLAHYLIACHLKREAPEYQPLAVHPDETDRAEKCFAKYLAWEKGNPLTPVMIETPLVSELFKYGGTPDLLAGMDDGFVLIDFKTGGRIYEDYFCQLAAYRKLLEEQDWPVANARILRISPGDDQYEVGIQLDFEKDWQIFQHALAIYRLREG